MQKAGKGTIQHSSGRQSTVEHPTYREGTFIAVVIF